MDLQERLTIDINDFFQENANPLRLPEHLSEGGESVCSREVFAFNIEESLNLYENENNLPLPLGPNFEECELLRDNQDVDDTNPLDDPAAENPREEQLSDHISMAIEGVLDSADVQIASECGSEQPSQGQLEQIINYLVQFSNLPLGELRHSFQKRFPPYARCPIVQILLQKFSKIKKTKEELIKYCMRKAFKFILELPKNRHMLNNQKSQKFSFSKCKNRYLKKVSDEKSMNNKFLQQIFNDGDFSQDYQIFLGSFEQIMVEDNQKKVRYLAWLLTNQKEGKKRTVEVVKRLPWTHFILQKVRKISQELLKFSSKGQ